MSFLSLHLPILLVKLLEFYKQVYFATLQRHDPPQQVNTAPRSSGALFESWADAGGVDGVDCHQYAFHVCK